MGAHVEPSDATAEHMDAQAAFFEIGLVDTRNLQLAARRGGDAAHHVAHPAIVIVKPGHCVGRARLYRLFLDPHHRAVVIEFDDAIVIRLADVIGEHGGGGAFHARGLAQHAAKAFAVKNIVAEQCFEQTLLLGPGDDQNVRDISQHQRAQGVIDHRLVVDRQQLLGDAPRCRREAGAAAAGQIDALAHHRRPAAFAPPIRPRRSPR